MLTGGPRGSPDSSDPMVDGVRHPLDSGCAGYILYSAYPVLMGRCGFREILCKAAVAVRRAVLPWVLLYAGLCPAALIFLFRLAVCLPSYAWLMSIVFYKESALFLYRLYWLHQCGIPHRSCRFHCCLAAHQRTRKKDSAEPSFPILWTPPHPPGGIRCGGALLLPRAYRDIGSLYPVQVDHRHFDVVFGCFVFGLRLFAFQ